MKKNIIPLVLMSLLVAPVMADKLEVSGKVKPTAEQKEARKSAIEAKEEFDEDRVKNKKVRKDKEDEYSESKGLDKQSNKKSKQDKKEPDKGSNKGKESRKKNSKKWW